MEERTLERSYHAHTEFTHRYARLKCLDFVVDAIRAFQGTRPPEAIRILEIGCGNGNMTRPLGSLGYRVFASDVDLASVMHARRSDRFPNVSYFVAKGEEIRLRGTFDLVLCADVLEHVDDPAGLARVANEHLAEEGRLILSVPNGYGLAELVVAGLEGAGRALKALSAFRPLEAIKRTFFSDYYRLPIDSSNPHSRHHHRFTLDKVRAMFEAQGLRTLHVGRSEIVTGALMLQSSFKLPVPVHKADWRLADHAPGWAVGGWYFVMEKR